MHRRKFLRDSLFGAPLLKRKRSSERSIAKPVDGPDASATATDPRRRLDFNRMLVHWSHPLDAEGSIYVDSGYLPFIDEVQPQLVQVGFYGCDFWAFAHVPEAVRGAIQGALPGDGNRKACGQWFENLNHELHKRGIKVVGHFDVEYHVTGLINGPQGPREGFFKFYNELWDENEFGPKPVKDPLELLQRKADGTPFVIEPQGLLAVAPLSRLHDKSALANGPQGVRKAGYRAWRGRIRRELLLSGGVHVPVVRSKL